jgi:hypothetical protein
VVTFAIVISISISCIDPQSDSPRDTSAKAGWVGRIKVSSLNSSPNPFREGDEGIYLDMGCVYRDIGWTM